MGVWCWQGGFLFMDTPFFDVDVELTIPSVSLHPSLVSRLRA